MAGGTVPRFTGVGEGVPLPPPPPPPHEAMTESNPAAIINSTRGRLHLLTVLFFILLTPPSQKQMADTPKAHTSAARPSLSSKTRRFDAELSCRVLSRSR